MWCDRDGPGRDLTNLVDLHCHILPALDDGALDLEDSIAMAAQADGDGIDLICATPHIRSDHAVVIPELTERVAALNAELALRGIRARVATGGEVAQPLAGDLSDEELELVSLAGGGRWLLLEPAAGPLADDLVHTVDALGARGYRCLVAHPERHLADDSATVLSRAVAAGALVQATAATLADTHAAGLHALAERSLVHVLGSDSHSARAGRPVSLSQGLEVLRRIAPVAPHLDWISHTAPSAIVAGEDVDPPF